MRNTPCAVCINVILNVIFNTIANINIIVSNIIGNKSLFFLCGLIVRLRVVLRRTVLGDIDRRFDNMNH